MRGGEYVLDAIAEIFPRAELFTLLYVPGKIAPTLTTLKRHTSLLQRIPAAEKRYRSFLPIFPNLIERFDLSGFDLILSTSHCVAKGVRKPPGAVHVSYLFAPMRYMWDRYEDYFGPGRASPPVRLAARLVRKPMRNWDRRTSSPERIDQFIALSHYIGDQVRDLYGREAKIVFPFADLSRFSLPRKPGRNYLMVGAFAPYKRVDLAIEAFNRLQLPLLIVGDGQDQKRLEKLAGPTVEFLGGLSNPAIADLYSKCKAFVFPGQEDFGITPLEAMASGAPVIAYKAGGALDTVTERSGLFFEPQTVEALMQAVLKIERGEVSFSEEECRAQAAKFSRQRFQREYASVVRQAWSAAGKPAEPLELAIRSGWSSMAEEL